MEGGKMGGREGEDTERIQRVVLVLVKKEVVRTL